MVGRRLLTAACVAVVAGAALLASVAAGEVVATHPRVSIFYYPWWGTQERDGAWLHWSQSARQPPIDVAASYYPARGAYSSSDPAVVAAHMREIARAGIDTVIVSWWGEGSHEDRLLPLVGREARARRLRVAVHLEPWTDRTAADAARAIDYLLGKGVREFYVYDSTRIADAQWAAALARVSSAATVYANTALVGKARRGGFDGIYTYDVYVHSGASFKRICKQARAARLLCAPSVGPGYDARRATGDGRVQPRTAGRRYDAMWQRAIDARPDGFTITSYNEWHEGTQIEAARAVGPPYASYEGAYGLTGARAERAYVDRTAFWVARARTAAAASTPAQ